MSSTAIRIASSLAVLAASQLPLSAASAQQSISVQVPQIITSGEAEAKVVPDRATVFVGVQTKAATAAAAGQANARRIKAVLDTLRSGLALLPTQLTTVNYNVSPEMEYDKERRTPRVVGYVVTNTVRVALNKIDQAGPAIDAALSKGANEVSGIEFSASNAEEVRRTALAAAVADARADAQAMAAAAGGTLGELLELSSSAPAYRPKLMARGMADMAQASAPPTSIEGGEQTLTASVSARWRFVPR